MKDIYRSDKTSLGKPANSSPKADHSEQAKTDQKSMRKKTYQDVYQMIGKSKGFIGSFVARPKKVNFEGQGEEEKIILLVRRHWITNIKWITVAIIMLFAPLLVGQFPLLANFPPNFQFASVVFWYLITIAFIIEESLSWVFTVGIITDKRVIDFDFFALFYKRISDAQINKIQDVTVQVSGAARTFFRFGNVFIQTAGEKPEIEFTDIPNPSLVVKVLEKLRLTAQS